MYWISIQYIYIYNNSKTNELKWYWDWKITDNNIFNSYEDAMEDGVNYVTTVLTKFENK